MPSSWPEVLLALAAPMLAMAILVFWLCSKVSNSGSINVHLKFMGMTLSVRYCSLSERECTAALTTIRKEVE